MGRLFIVEDRFHAEQMGQFESEREARQFLDELRDNPTSMLNRPPCKGWRTCSRQYFLCEYDTATAPGTLIASEAQFEVGQGAVVPIE